MAATLEPWAVAARVTPRCPVFGTCGGCRLQDVAYEAQLAAKQCRVQAALAPLGVASPVAVQGLADPWRYRNRAEFTFGERQGELVLGYHEAGSFTRVVDLADCWLLPEAVMAVVQDVRRLSHATGLRPYHPRTHQGFFRYLLVRHSPATGQLMVCLLTAPGQDAAMRAFGETLAARQPAIASLFWGVLTQRADVARTEALTLLSGAAHFEDQIGPYRLQLQPFSFLQVCHAQADALYGRLREILGDLSTQTVWDLYCGVGVISLYLAAHAGQVHGIDSEPEQVALAAENARRNGLTNAAFYCGTVEEALLDRRQWLDAQRPDVVVVDPPRAGMHLQALSAVLAARPRRIAYLSCQPDSLARDLRVLTGSFPRYRVEHAEAFDMFPHTPHVETLVVLDRM